VTSVRKATDALQPFEQKYAIMEDLELPIGEVPKPETKVATDGTVEVDGFKIDGSVQTYRAFNAGPVDFTATIDGEGFINGDKKEVLWNYMSKHLVSVKNHCTNKIPLTEEQLEEKIGDIISYCTLLRFI
jgi:hypothetical protein